MDIYYDLQGFKKLPNLVIALGNFDGVHMGHRELIRKTVTIAQEINGTPALFTFDPHPMKVLQPDAAPALLLTREDKIRMMSELGIQVMIIAPFSEAMARLKPETFVYDILQSTIAAQEIVVGYNYTFGRRGEGDPVLLQQLAQQSGYRLTIIPPVFAGRYEVSSSFIRQFLLAGDVEKAGQLLGYQPFIRGWVTTGDRRGREIGFPTANLDLPEELLAPAHGVYAVNVLIKGDSYCGVANIGIKPTFAHQRPKNLEVHILDFCQDVYGQEVKVIFLARLREEKTFCDAAELVRQINADCAAAKDFFRYRVGHKQR